MADLNADIIKNLTMLSRIECSEEEQAALLKDLSHIVEYIEQLKEVDTKDVPACNHVLEEMTNVMREDEVGEVLPREVFLANAPSEVSGMIRVPPVIKKKD